MQRNKGNKIIIILANQCSDIVLFKSNQQLAKKHRVLYIKLGQLARFFKCHTSSIATANLSASHNGKLLLQNNCYFWPPALCYSLCEKSFWGSSSFCFWRSKHQHWRSSVGWGGIYMKCGFSMKNGHRFMLYRNFYTNLEEMLIVNINMNITFSTCTYR